LRCVIYLRFILTEIKLIHDAAISLFLNAAGTYSTDIELNELFETESDDFTLAVHSAVKVDWRKWIITRVAEDSLYDRSHPAHNAIRAILAQDSYSLTSNEFTSCLLMDTMRMMHKPCCVDMLLPPASMAALALQPRATMTAPTYVPLKLPVKPPTSPIDP
jgi:hypothetical protein